MDLEIKINMDNAAFGNIPRYEVGQILRKWTVQIAGCNYGEDLKPGYEKNLMDTNGNTVGYVKVVD